MAPLRAGATPRYPKKMVKPSLFIGSSVEGKGVAEAIQVNLEYDVTSTIWHQGVFGLSSNTLQSLVRAVKDFDFAVLVLTPDDMTTKRGQSFSVPRDNLLFELGLFMGYLGPERTFAVHPRDQGIHLPTDLAGVATATYEKAEMQTLQSALGPVCTKIKTAIAGAPPRPRLEGDTPSSTVYSELRELRSMVTTLVESIGSRPSIEGWVQGDVVSAFLAGTWRNVETDSVLYCRPVNGEIRTVYCYGGNNSATGEYFSWRLAGGELFGKFRWFSHNIDGYVWMRKTNPNLLEGGWWFSESIDSESGVDPERLKKSRGMQRSTWKRLENVPYPQWAEDYLSSPRT
jgi:Predicted nucleotide-binding protein containing TIR-like domain